VRQSMKAVGKAIATGIAVCALTVPAFASAYTINGVIRPRTKPYVISLHKPIPAGLVQLTLSALPKNAGVPYALDFCIGPAANPCASPGSQVFTVFPGQPLVVMVQWYAFSGNVFAVTQGTTVVVPYSVTVAYVPYT
jgi:hypothetical protein